MFVLLVEQEELGITVGLQDRVIQVYEGLVYMDFDRSRERVVDGLTCYCVRAAGSGARCRRSTSRTTGRSASRPKCFTTTSASASTAAISRSSDAMSCFAGIAGRGTRGAARGRRRPARAADGRELRHCGAGFIVCPPGRSAWSKRHARCGAEREVRRLGRRDPSAPTTATRCSSRSAIACRAAIGSRTVKPQVTAARRRVRTGFGIRDLIVRISRD